MDLYLIVYLSNSYMIITDNFVRKIQMTDEYSDLIRYFWYVKLKNPDKITDLILTTNHRWIGGYIAMDAYQISSIETPHLLRQNYFSRLVWGPRIKKCSMQNILSIELIFCQLLSEIPCYAGGLLAPTRSVFSESVAGEYPTLGCKISKELKL